MEFEPNLVVPCPFRLEPSKVERSTGLDLTPEKPLVRKTKLPRRNTQCGSYGSTNLTMAGTGKYADKDPRGKRITLSKTA